MNEEVKISKKDWQRILAKMAQFEKRIVELEKRIEELEDSAFGEVPGGDPRRFRHVIDGSCHDFLL
jgi:hypothetical protein